jgi:hypothetical protein
MNLPQWKPIESAPKDGRCVHLLLRRKLSSEISVRYTCWYCDLISDWVQDDGDHLRYDGWEIIGWMETEMEDSDNG